MDVADTHDTISDAVCEICGSTDFKEVICHCSQCNNCNVHVYCMLKNIQYIPDAWTCDECLATNGVNDEPVCDTVGEADEETTPKMDRSDDEETSAKMDQSDDEETSAKMDQSDDEETSAKMDQSDDKKTSAKMDQSDDETNFEKQGEIQQKVLCASHDDTILEELGQDKLTAALVIADNVCHQEDEGTKVALEALGDRSGASCLEQNDVKADIGASDDIHIDAPNKRVLLEDSVMADVDCKPEAQSEIVSLKASGGIHIGAPDKKVLLEDSVMADVDSKPEAQVEIVSLKTSCDSDSNPQSDMLGATISQKASYNPASDPNSGEQSKSLGDAKNDMKVHAEKVTPMVSGITDYGTDSVDQGRKVLSEASNAGSNNSCLVESGKTVPPKASDCTGSVFHSEELGKKAPLKALSGSRNDYYSAENCTKVIPKDLNGGNTQALYHPKDALVDMRAVFKAKRERIDNLASNMRHLKEELHSLLQKMDNVRRREENGFPGMHRRFGNRIW